MADSVRHRKRSARVNPMASTSKSAPSLSTPLSPCARLIRRFKSESFRPTWLGIASNPFYLIRRGLFLAVNEQATKLSGTVLDFGCGSRPYESLFTRATCYIGLDTPISGHDHAGSRVDVLYDGRTLPFAAAAFDGVVSFEVFEHVFEPDAALDEIRRVLKPQGHLLLTTPFAWDEHEQPYDYARYTSFGLQHLLRRNGFEVLELKKTTTYVRAIGQVLIAYVSQHLSPRGKWTARLFQLLFVAPLTLLVLVMDAVLPKRYEYFSNCLVLARKSL